MLVYCRKIGFSRSRIRIFSEWEIKGGICLWLLEEKKILIFLLSPRLVCHFVNRSEGYPEVIWNKSVFWSQSSVRFKTPGLLHIVLANSSQHLDFDARTPIEFFTLKHHLYTPLKRLFMKTAYKWKNKFKVVLKPKLTTLWRFIDSFLFVSVSYWQEFKKLVKNDALRYQLRYLSAA